MVKEGTEFKIKIYFKVSDELEVPHQAAINFVHFYASDFVKLKINAVTTNSFHGHSVLWFNYI